MSTSSVPDPLPPDRDLGPALVILTCILTVISVVTLVLRYWVRTTRRSLAWDDYTIGAAVVLAVIRTVLQIIQVHYGDGRHTWYLSAYENRVINEYGWIAQVLLFATNCLVKISICLLVLRIKDTKRLRFWLYIMMGGLLLFNLVPIIVLLAECHPVKAYWDPTAGHCWNSKIRIYVIYCAIGYGIITDLICTALPLFVVRNTLMPLRKKLSVSGLMCLGLMATACSVGRAQSLSLNAHDLPWSYCIAAIWSNLELHLGIIASNMTAAPAIIKRVREHSNNSENRTGNDSYSGGPYGTGSKSNHLPNNLNSKSRANRLDSLDDITDRTFDTTVRRTSSAKSGNSGYPLHPGAGRIMRETTFYVDTSDAGTNLRNSSLETILSWG